MPVRFRRTAPSGTAHLWLHLRVYNLSALVPVKDKMLLHRRLFWHPELFRRSDTEQKVR